MLTISPPKTFSGFSLITLSREHQREQLLFKHFPLSFHMNKTQLLTSLKQKGFSKQILDTFSKIPRENFVSKQLEDRAYEDTPLKIGRGQTISQPYTIAMMLEMLELKKSQKVLEIGSGCGYVLALLSKIVGEDGQVFGIEVIKELAEKSKQNLKGYKNIKVYHGNAMEMFKAPHRDFRRVVIKKSLTRTGREAYKRNRKVSFEGLKEHIFYDRILISAACEKIPQSVLEQLKYNGILVAPVGLPDEQSLVAVQKDKDKYFLKKEIPGFTFVPFVEN